MAAGMYPPEYSMPLDRWVVVPVMRLLPARTRARTVAANDITDVTRALPPGGGVPGLPDWEYIPTPGIPRVTLRTCAASTACSCRATPS